MRLSIGIILLLFSSACFGFAGDWKLDPRSDDLRKTIRKDFSYFNQQTVRFVGRYSGGVRVIGTRTRRLSDKMIDYVIKTASIVPLDVITCIEETDTGLVIHYGEYSREILYDTPVPVQSTADYEVPNVVLTERGTNFLLVETIGGNGTTATEVFTLTQSIHGAMRLEVTIVVRSLSLPSPLKLTRHYIP